MHRDKKLPAGKAGREFLRGERNETSYDNEITFLMPSLRPSSRSPYASIGKRPVISAFTALGQRSKKTPRSRIEFSNESRPALTVPKTRSEEHTSELQSRGLISYAVFCLKQ